MSYIWTNYQKENYFKVSLDGVSPYREADQSANLDDSLVRVNPYSRLSNILLPKELIMAQEDPDKQRDFENHLLSQYVTDDFYGDVANLLIHGMARLDLLRGMTSIDLHCILEELSIVQGHYGESLRKNFNTLEERDQNIILYHLTNYDQKKQVDVQLLPVLRALFPRVEHHFEVCTQIFHFYIPIPENNYNSCLFQVVETLFKPLTAHISLMWADQCFGRVEEDVTMVIDNIGIL